MSTRESDALERAVSVVPKPLIRQALLLVPISLDVAVVWATGSVARAGGFYLAGLALLLLATMVAVLCSTASLPARWAESLPFLDLAALGLMGLVADHNGLGVLAVLPAMWLGADRGLRGAGQALAATVVLVSLPTLVFFGPAAFSWSHALLIAAIATMCSLTVAGLAQVWTTQNRRLAAQGRRLEEALQEMRANRALNEAILTTVDVGLLALDQDGNHRAVNPRHEEFLALAYPEGAQARAGEPGAVYGPDRVRPLDPDDYPTTRAVRGESFTDSLVWVGSPTGRQRALSVSARPVETSTGDSGGSVLVYKDVTDLVSALAVKDQFLASVSHELRTPLTTMMGFLEMVLDDAEVTPDTRQQLLVVQRSSERLMRLVDDLLFTAQVDEGQVPLTVTRVDLGTVVEQAVADLAPRAQDGGVTLVQRLASGAGLRGDPTRIRQVVDNLLSNAIKYSAAGDTVVLEVERGTDEVRLGVQDTGMGIAAQDLDHLFNRFYRASEARHRSIPGIGLGLAITKAIVGAHEGSIEVSSELGSGTRFVIRLPVTGPQLAAAGEPETEGHAPGLASREQAAIPAA